MAKQTAPAIDLNAAWDDALAFCRREQALLAPVAAASFGLSTLLVLAASAGLDPRAPSGAAALLGIGGVAELIDLFGGLAIAALVLRPGGSVADALFRAGRRLPAALVAWVVVGLGLLALLLLLSVLLAIPVAAGLLPQPAYGQLGASSLLILMLLLGVVLAVAVRLGTLNPLLADGELPPLRALRAALSQTRPVAWRLLLLWILFTVTADVVAFGIKVAIGALAAVAGAGGDGGAGGLIAMLLVAAVAAAAGAFWAVLMAMLYRRLPPPSAA